MGFQVPRAPRGEEGASCNMTPCLPAASLSTWFVALTRERIPEWGNFRLTRLTISLVVLWVLLFSSPSENFLTCGPLCNVYEGRLPRIVTRHGRHGFSQHSNTRTLAQLYQNRSVMYEFTNGIERSRSFQAPGTSCLWYTRFSASRMPGHWYFVPAAPKRSGLFSVPKCSIHAMVPLPLQQCYLSASHEIRESLGVSTDKLMKTSRGGSLTIYSSSTWFLDTIDRKVLAQVSDALALNRMLNQYRIARNKAHPQSLSERVEGTSRNEDLSLDASAVFARPPLEVEPLCGENGPQAFPRLVSNPPKESGEPLSFYFGVDLTAPSLHAGHLLPLLLLRRLWQQEHIRPILLLGTATTRLALHARRCLAAHGEKGRTSFQKGITGSGVSARKCMYPTSAAFNILNNSYWRQYDGEIHENEAFILGQLRRIFAYPTPRTPCHKEVASPRNSSNSQIITDSEVHNSTVGVSERSGSENSALPVPLVVRNSSWLDGLSCGAFLCGAAQALPLSDVYSRMLSRESALVARGVLHRRVRGTNSTSCGNARRTAPQFGVGVSGVSTVGDLGYAVLQAVDFFVLSQLLNCRGQIGGRDQWGNIATGLHVARRLYLQRLCNSPRTSQLSEFEELKHSMRGKEEEVGETSAYEDTSGKTGAKMMEPNKDPFPLIGVTTQLLETSAGKMSKSSGDGTLWLRADWTSPLDFWQHWRSIGDHVALRYLLWFSSRPASKTRALAEYKDVQIINQMKEDLADELTRLVHGEEELSRVRSLVGHLQQLKSATDSARDPRTVSHLPNLPATHRIHKEEFTSAGEGPLLSKALRDLNLAGSGLEAKRLIKEGAVRINGIRETDTNRRLLIKDFLVSAYQQSPENSDTDACHSVSYPKVATANAPVGEVLENHGKATISVGRKRIGVLALDTTS